MSIEITDDDIKAAARHWCDRDESGAIGILVTGPDERRQAWAFDVWPEVFDGRAKTNRCFLWFCSGQIPRERLVTATEAVKKHDVTLQLLCVGKPDESSRQQLDLGGGATASVADMQEWYPVLHLASNGNKWPPKKRKPSDGRAEGG